MIKITALSAFVCLASFAGPLIDEGKIYNHLSENTVRNCPNFSGQWKGICQSEGTKYDVDIEITQVGCDYVQLSNVGIPIGGTSSQSMTSASGGSYQVTLAADWKEDKLEIQGTLLTRGLDRKAESGSYFAEAKRYDNKLELWLKSSHKSMPEHECQFEIQS